MSEDLLPTFNPTDRENQRLREENIRLKQLLTLHGIPIPPPSPLAQLQTLARKTAEVESGKERAPENCLFSQPFSGQGRRIRGKVANSRWPRGVFTLHIEKLESYQPKQAGGEEEGRSGNPDFVTVDRHSDRKALKGTRNYRHLSATGG